MIHFSEDIFKSFIKNKILKHKSIFQLSRENEKISNIFTQTFLFVYNSLDLKLAQDAAFKGDKKLDRNTIIKKGDALPFGFLYCSGENYIKIQALFNIFSSDGQIKKSEKFSKFLLSLFIIASYCMVSARNKLSKFEEIGEIKVEKLKEILNYSTLSNCQHMVEVTYNLMFGEKEKSLSYDKFKNLFIETNKKKSLAFLLSAPGARYMLIKNCV